MCPPIGGAYSALVRQGLENQVIVPIFVATHKLFAAGIAVQNNCLPFAWTTIYPFTLYNPIYLMSAIYPFTPIAYVRSPYPQKFGVARQPGLVPAATAVIELLPEFTADCIRGLAGFDYIWLQFVFHAVLDEGWSPLVRPPRLGGSRKMGVFATRSPHRPNHLGLSLLKLEAVTSAHPVRLQVSGADLIDGTPVLDIKPYIPFVEAKPDAQSGFVVGAPPQLLVHWSDQAQKQCQQLGLDHNWVLLAEQSIAQDPRPAYQNDPQRLYSMRLHQTDVQFRIDHQQAWIVALVPVT